MLNLSLFAEYHIEFTIMCNVPLKMFLITFLNFLHFRGQNSKMNQSEGKYYIIHIFLTICL